MITINSKYQKTVLVVEDAIASNGNLSVLLASRGYRVLTARNGREAIEKSNLPIDLVVLDLILPDMSGLEVCHYLKKTELTHKIPIIILSDRTCAVDERVQCFQLGADDFLSKPFEIEEFVVRVFALLRRNNGEEFQERNQRVEHFGIIREIVNRELVIPFFQPIYYVEQNCRVFGVEVLSRPQVQGPLCVPEVLFKVALDLGMYIELETMVWKKALNLLDKNPVFEKIFLNCSPCLIETSDSSQLRKIFDERYVDPKNIYLELSERSAINEYQFFYERLRNFRREGFNIVVDDIGSGYASLESVIETRPQIVKIDKRIIHGVLTDPLKRSIIKLVVSFCNEHDIICVAEGVEGFEEFYLLKQFGVKAFQGYLFCKPEMIEQLNAATGLFFKKTNFDVGD